ncbi:hypothetical protein GCM10007385_44290 [Tateyamaria omphalii]|uniref:type II secretion system protein GspJ n=1 Tax=Tateyamaria omphalii TaxID=299262 RepID=UPI001672D7D7|nr:type II secretion system protein GspJ [Tateyamaria omphalii]GGX70424.1 hypothetical protein GCM10007385_44290 [Tateyamaria omphalii]
MIRRDDGMSLIELVAAMAVFGLISVMAVQALSGTLRARDSLSALQIETAALTRPLGLLRNDLASVVPLAFYPPERAAPRSALGLAAGGNRLEMTVAGQLELTHGNTVQSNEISRVEWRLDPVTGVLYRRVWRALTPLNAAAAGPEVSVMSGVRQLTVRSFWPNGIGWRPGVSTFGRSTGPLDEDNAAYAGFSTWLPDAVEVTLTTVTHGDIRLMETFQ